MKKKFGFLIAFIAVISMLLAPMVALAADTGSVGTTAVVLDSQVFLDNKDSSWNTISDAYGVTVGYNASGPEFVWAATGKVMAAGTYNLIYYADKPDRFVDWGGDNPGAIIATIVVESDLVVSGQGSIELNKDLPCAPDANEFQYDYSDGSQPGPVYPTAHGAKLWLVPASDYTASALTAWNPSTYLFETDLINYDDTDVISSMVSITVTGGPINFGNVIPGKTADGGTVTVTNDGTVYSTITASVSGAGVFENIYLDTSLYSAWSVELDGTDSVSPAVTLAVPNSFSGGLKTGTLLFVASPYTGTP